MKTAPHTVIPAKAGISIRMPAPAYLLLLHCFILTFIAPAHAQQPTQCAWVLAKPAPWPPCAGGMRTRYTPYVSSSAGCTPIFPQPMDLAETEACEDDTEGHSHAPRGATRTTLYTITIPAGMTRCRCTQTITIEATEDTR